MISWRTPPCILKPNASWLWITLMRALFARQAAATASSFSAVVTAPSTASGLPGSGSVTRNLWSSSVSISRLERISSGFPTRGRRWGFAPTVAVNMRSTAVMGDAVVHCAKSRRGPGSRESRTLDMARESSSARLRGGGRAGCGDLPPPDVGARVREPSEGMPLDGRRPAQACVRAPPPPPAPVDERFPATVEPPAGVAAAQRRAAAAPASLSRLQMLAAQVVLPCPASGGVPNVPVARSAAAG